MLGGVIARPFARRGARRSSSAPISRHDYADAALQADSCSTSPRTTRTDEVTGIVQDFRYLRGTWASATACTPPPAMTTTFDRLIACARAMPDRLDHLRQFRRFLIQAYGHRRNIAGYAAALEAFDARIPALQAALQPGDLVVFSADHGCDPTWKGTDHTREYIPVLAFWIPASRRGRWASAAPLPISANPSPDICNSVRWMRVSRSYERHGQARPVSRIGDVRGVIED